jgi:uncharacterized protein YbjT (DUF2867 family)
MDRVLVIGSSGNVGRAVMEELARRGEQVRAGSRYPSQLKAPAGVERIHFDYADPGTFAPALQGVSRVFLNPPPDPAPHKVMIPFVKAAARENRKIVLQTQLGTEFGDDGPLRQVEVALERSPVPWVILRPNWFMDNFHTYWLAPIQEGGVIPLPAADSRTSLIDSRDIGAAAAATLRTDRFNRRAFALTGPQSLTYAEAAAVLSEAAGRDIRYVAVDDETFVKSLVDAGAPAELAQFLAGLFNDARQGAAAAISSAVEELTGHAPRTLAQYARDHAAAWARVQTA